ncbi:MAG: tRNA pseudouridine(55) synthase TruB [Nitrospinota bacterium]|nr:tRNA pseudouridine(55) synthase TruB [Nitrospinota bacterium]
MIEINDGFLIINKPQGITSAEVTRVIKKRIKVKKIGYLGTLDPLAIGVLVVALGKATRLIMFMEKEDKEYDASLTLGAETDTQDSEGEVVNQADPSHITEDQVKELLPRYTGEIDQVPPMYSAKKQQGQRLYALARQGITVERKPVRVNIRSLSVTGKEGPVVHLSATVSTGVYLRTLCHDIGNELGVYGHLSALTRVRSGIFKIEDSIPLDMITKENLDEVNAKIIPLAEGLANMNKVTVVPHATGRLGKGMPLGVSEIIKYEDCGGGELVRIVGRDGAFYGVGKAEGPSLAGFPFSTILPRRVII